MHQDYIWNLIAKKLSGEASSEELHQLEKLLRANPELHYPMQTIMDLWRTEANTDIEENYEAFNKHADRLKNLGIDIISGNEYLNGQNYTSNTLMHKRNYWWAAIAAPLIAGIVFFSVEFSGSGNNKNTNNVKQVNKTVSEISTKNGSKTNIILPDGTKVWLNASSNLTYDSSYGKSIREVTLSGEGFFDVVRNKEKPFIIHASKINIKVLGTEFNVKSYPTDKTIEASLIRGSIEVTFKDRPSKKVILKPNEKIVVENIKSENRIVRPAARNGNSGPDISENISIKNLTYEHKTGAVIETSWVENNLIFQDESFEDIARQLERWYGVTIKFESEQLKVNHLTGNFKNETIRQALDALKFTASFNYSIDANNNITIY